LGFAVEQLEIRVGAILTLGQIWPVFRDGAVAEAIVRAKMRRFIETMIEEELVMALARPR
jgi:hypothetical protein